MEKEFEKIKQLLKKAKTAIIATHVDPDGDAIGSLLSLGELLEQKGLATTLYCESPVPEVYRFLPGTAKIKRKLELAQHFDLGFVVDAANLSRIGDKINLKPIVSRLVNIDHHPDNTRFGDVNYVVQSSSVAEEIFELAQYLKIKINKALADCLYTAMVTDTGNFRYENTSVKTFLMAAKLLSAGVKTQELTTRIFDTKSIPAIRLSARVLSNLKFSAGRKVAWASVTEALLAELEARAEDLIGIVDQIRSIEGIEIALLLREDKGKVKINFRSKETANVSELARRFGGGGHNKAAGCVIEGSIAEIEPRVIEETLKFSA
jgi:phosphoesterase RecJ-like protein